MIKTDWNRVQLDLGYAEWLLNKITAESKALDKKIKTVKSDLRRIKNIINKEANK